MEPLDFGPAVGDECRGSIPRGQRRPRIRVQTTRDVRRVGVPALTGATGGPISASAIDVDSGCP